MIDCFFAARHPVVDPTAVRSGSVVPRAAGAVFWTWWFARSRFEVKWKLAMVEHEADRWIILLGEGNDPEVAMRELENMGEPGASRLFDVCEGEYRYLGRPDITAAQLRLSSCVWCRLGIQRPKLFQELLRRMKRLKGRSSVLGYTGDERWLTAVDENEADQWIIMVAEENMPARPITELEKLGRTVRCWVFEVCEGIVKKPWLQNWDMEMANWGIALSHLGQTLSRFLTRAETITN